MKYLVVVLLLVSSLNARSKTQGWCQDGGYSVSIPGGAKPSANKFQRSFLSCTVTVYNAGTLIKPTLYSDNAGTVKGNPFTAALTDGLWYFYADNGRYDITFSGGGIPAPFTLGDTLVYDARIACLFPGADWGAKINNAEADLPATGGTIDARCFEGAITNATAVTLNKPTVLLLGEDNIRTSTTITVSSSNVSVWGNGIQLAPNTGGIGGTTLTWTGALGGGPIMTAQNGSHYFDIRGITFDCAALCNVGLAVLVNPGSTTKHPWLQQLQFQGYRTRGLVLGIDDTVNLKNGQFEMLTATDLIFRGGGVLNTIGVLHNAQNTEHSTIINLYCDVEPVNLKNMDYCLYNRAGEVDVISGLATRIDISDFFAQDAITVRNWRTEDAVIYTSAAAPYSAPTSFHGIMQRGHQADNPAPAVFTFNGLSTGVDTGAGFSITDAHLQGSVIIGATNEKEVTLSNVRFENVNLPTMPVVCNGPQACRVVWDDPYGGRVYIKTTTNPVLQLADSTNATDLQLVFNTTGNQAVLNKPLSSSGGYALNNPAGIPTQGWNLGWNFSNGQGEADLFVNRNNNAQGGLRIYDWDGATATLLGIVGFLDGGVGLANRGFATSYTKGVTAANLPAVSAAETIWCTDCTAGASPCAASGGTTGVLAQRTNAATWRCP